LRVEAYRSEPGTGMLIPFDIKGNALPALSIEDRIDDDKVNAIPECKIHTFRVSTILAHAGDNKYLVRWPTSRPIGGKTERVFALRNVSARGLIRCAELGRLTTTPAPLQVEQQLTFEVNANGLPDGASIILQAVGRKLEDGEIPEAGGYEERIELTAQEGVFRGKFKFDKPGWYTLVHRPGPNDTLRLKSAYVLVAFDFKQALQEATIRYNGGWAVQKIFGTDQVTMESVGRLENRHTKDCRFEIRLLFPRSEKDALVLKGWNQTKFAVKDNWVEFDPTKHLDASLMVSHGADRLEVKEERRLTGTLRAGEELQLDSFVKVSEDAIKKKTDGAHHATLGGENGMCLEVKMTWTEDDVSRTYYVPIAVHTRNAHLEEILANLIFWGVVGVVVVIGGLIAWKKGKLGVVLANLGSGERPAGTVPGSKEEIAPTEEEEPSMDI